MNKALPAAELILPERQLCPARTRILGYVSRAALLFLCTYGLSVFLCDALSMGIPRSIQAAWCLTVCAVLAVMGLSWKFFLGGTVLGAGAAALWFVSGGITPRIMTLYYAGISIYNAWFRRLNELGCHGMMRRVLNFDYSLRQLYLTEEDCRLIAYCIVTALLGAIAAFCILRRARIVPLLFTGAALATLVMYFGLCTNNTGFALMLASLCGVAALSYYDSAFNTRRIVSQTLGIHERSRECRRELRRTRRENSALGGYAGLFSALIALVLIWIPSGISSGMKDIPSISHPLLRMANFVMAVINCDSPDVGSFLFSGVSEIDSRSTTTERRTYTGAELFEVRADIHTPIYLRSWTGIDYAGDNWHSADYERIAAYKDIFGDGFSPELLTFELLEALDPDLTMLPEEHGAVPHTEFGYITSHVHVKKLTPSANVLFLPSYADQRLGLLTYGQRAREDVEYTNYYDGIFTGTSYLFLDEYSTVSNVPLLTDPDFAKNIGVMVDYFAEQYGMISILREVLASGESETTVRRMFEQMDAQRSVRRDAFETVGGEYTFPSGEDRLAWRYVYEMDAAGREKIHALVDNLSLYYDYVYDNYLSQCEGFGSFRKLAEAIVRNASSGINVRSISGRHEAAMAIIDFLSDRMVYTLSPKTPSSDREYVNAAESFLFDTGEGYCVQYATSAVMLLRALGIPARYAEGYITGTYAQLPEEDTPGSFSSTILDSNAHAWVEVYYDYYGWVQYEATAPYYAGMYIRAEAEEQNRPSGSLGYDEEYYEDTEYTDDPIFTLPDKDTFVTTGTVIGVFAVILAAAAIAIVVVVLRRRVREAEQERTTLLTNACSRTLDAEQRYAAARRIDDRILRLLQLKKLTPNPGEHQREFAARVDAELGRFASDSFAHVSEAMLACEFGTGISQHELERIARFSDQLRALVLRSANVFERLWFRFILLV